MRPDDEKIIDRSIEAYENIIKYIRGQILDLHRKKVRDLESCSECFTYKFETPIKK